MGRHLVAQALSYAFAASAETAEFVFAPENAALAHLVAALGKAVNAAREHAAIRRAGPARSPAVSRVSTRRRFRGAAPSRAAVG